MTYLDINKMEQNEINLVRERYREIRKSLGESCSHIDKTRPLNEYLGNLYRYYKICKTCGREFECTHDGELVKRYDI